jgi:hypothetical protein
VPPTANIEALTCSFCSKDQSQVAKLVAGPGVYICNDCVELCNQISPRRSPERGSGCGSPRRGAQDAKGQLGPDR